MWANFTGNSCGVRRLLLIEVFAIIRGVVFNCIGAESASGFMQGHKMKTHMVMRLCSNAARNGKWLNGFACKSSWFPFRWPQSCNGTSTTTSGSLHHHICIPWYVSAVQESHSCDQRGLEHWQRCRCSYQVFINQATDNNMKEQLLHSHVTCSFWCHSYLY